MKLYALVKENSVVGTGTLPSSYANISGFNLLNDDEVYKTHGFYPYEYNEPTYNKWLEELGDIAYEVLEDKVVGTRQVITLSEERITARNVGNLDRTLAMLNDILYSTDWVLLSDHDLSEEQEEAYLNLRRATKTAKLAVVGRNCHDLTTCMESISSNASDLRLRLSDFSDAMAGLAVTIDEIGLALL